MRMIENRNQSSHGLLGSAILPPSCIPKWNPMVPYVVHSYHWGQEVVFPPGTSQIHCKEMDKGPAKYPPRIFQVHSEYSQPVFLQFPHHRKLWILVQYPKWWNCSFPVRQLMGTFKRFPNNVAMMFWHGTFEMFLAISQPVGLWCFQSVKFKMNRNDGIEVCQSGMFGMSPPFSPECTTFSIFLGNSGNIAITFKMFPVFLVVRATLP